MRAVHFQACEVRPQYRTFFGNNERNDHGNLHSFGVNYDSVAQKWRILAIFQKLLGR